MLCLVGATIGVAAIALPWSGTGAGPWYEEWAFAAWICDLVSSHVSVLEFYLAFGFFLGGTILAFLTPVGGALQVIGLAEFCFEEFERQESFQQNSYYEGQFAVGFFVACISSAFVLVSIVRPLGIGYGEPPGSLWARLMVVSGTKTRLNCCPILRALGEHKSWAFAWGVSVLLLGTIVLAAEPQIGPREPMSQVEGGVMWIAGFRNLIPLSYNNSAVSLSDGQGLMTWQMHSGLLGNGTWASEGFGEMNLPGLTLALTIVDFSGDGRFGPGDTLVFAVTNGTSFAEDVTYDMRFYWPSDSGHIYGGRYVSITFEFHDGNLHSQMSASMPHFIM